MPNLVSSSGQNHVVSTVPMLDAAGGDEEETVEEYRMCLFKSSTSGDV